MGQLQAPVSSLVTDDGWQLESTRNSGNLNAIFSSQLSTSSSTRSISERHLHCYTMLHQAYAHSMATGSGSNKWSECSVNVSAQGSLRLTGTRRGQEVDWNEAKCAGNKRLNPGKSNAHFIVLCTPAVVVVKHETDENDCERYNTDHLLCLENTCHQNTDHHKLGNRVQTSGVAGNK